jgi:hypothetical protein
LLAENPGEKRPPRRSGLAVCGLVIANAGGDRAAVFLVGEALNCPGVAHHAGVRSGCVHLVLEGFDVLLWSHQIVGAVARKLKNGRAAKTTSNAPKPLLIHMWQGW